MMVEDNKTGKPLEHYTAEFAGIDPEITASRTKCDFSPETGEFTVSLFGHKVIAHWPEFSLKAADPASCPESLLGPYAQILILRYLIYGAAAPFSGEYRSYREFPWAQVYDANFQGRCIKRLAFGFGYNIPKFVTACEKLNGEKLKKGDASYSFPIVGSCRVSLIMYGADDEFPPSSQFLFSDNCESAFSAEDLVVVGDLIINTLKELAK